MAVLLVVWYGGMQVVRGHITSGLLAGYLLYSLQVAMALGFLSSLFGDFMQAVGASIRIFQLMDAVPEIGIEGGIVPKLPADAPLILDKVDFRYPARADTQVLHEVSVTIAPGSIVALVGPSGGGKSTLVGLLERWYSPTKGKVTLGGVDLRDIDPAWLHHHMALVGQEPVLFAMSIRENIKYGRATATDEEVEAAARMANAHDFIQSFEEGYDTMVGERGVRLSGGQKQRVAIARALLVQPEILLLDEATSALDAESEHEVQTALDRAMMGRTVIVIAHRLSTIRNANVILVVQKGRIVEQGTHEELLRARGTYCDLVQRQLQVRALAANTIHRPIMPEQPS
ncbi:uncharacterized protein MONBRDRAFT_12463 [Monosiga brevicollis MX1]|uniref:ABC transporter domain-containing protein n=1 Tax=Monosiga brevicollis TaxID=81824 RepID=A9VCC5_MONBE|nr:uncharacterized protein MONBRDRAFT_12463 [Monosiga brevicollis MX1]EDQ84875.1 predicted protein [Monosiga brevicollis MX1]|eukprot:XP_001750376.1 hypothetical protein [Monosiga brevicollis MX1]